MTLLPIRIFQLACATLAAAVVSRPLPPADAVAFTLSVVGERELPDGSWEGVDLLTQREEIDRFQIVLTPSANVRAHLEAITDDGPERIHPSKLERAPLLDAWEAAAFPTPRTFFEVAGTAKLRVVVTPENQGDREFSATIATATGDASSRVFRLTDGAPVRVSEKRFEGRGALAVELELAGRR